VTVSPGAGLREFAFDHVFGRDSEQREVYEYCGLGVAVDFVNGTSGAIIVYGQTGSGKTHTMFGPPGAVEGSAEGGLAGRVSSEVIDVVERRRTAGIQVTLDASYVEVFGNEISDLLSDEAVGAHRGANQRMGHRYALNGSLSKPVESTEELNALLQSGNDRKRRACTAMNDRSSRAHAILILRLRQQSHDQEEPVESYLFLADLGGSEKLTKSKANENVRAPGAINVGNEEVARVTWEEYYHGRQRVNETNNINKGLLVLKRCITALRDRKSKTQRVPFADSKLTQLLEPALGGPSRTVVVVCCSEAEEHAEETVQSLRFGEMCRSVEHQAAVTDSSSAVRSVLRQLNTEIAEVEEAIKAKERWETRVTKRQHVVNELNGGTTKLNTEEEMELGGFGAVDFIPDDGTSTRVVVEHEVVGEVLVGAEAERERLEELLDRRRKLLGQQ